MIYLELFLGFLKVGFFAFGGAYGAIPLIREIVMSYGWISEEMLTYMIAVSESTPGPIMVNLATYVGNTQAGVLGALLATLAVVLPSFFIILLVTAFLKTAIKNKYVNTAISGVKPCIVGIILATGIYMIISCCFPVTEEAKTDLRMIILTAFLFAVCFIYKHIAKKKLSPILLIVVSAVAGIVVFGAM